MVEEVTSNMMRNASSFPSDWQVLTFGDISNVKRGASPRPISSPRWFSDSGTGWIRIADVTRSKKYLRETEQYLSEEGISKSVLVKPGDLIMSICGTIGRPVILDMEACIHDGFVLFSELPSSVEANYLYYFLENKSEEFSSKGQPGTQKNLNTSIIKTTTVPVPPLSEQKKIAEILTSADEAIEATGKVIEQTKKVKQGLLKELLTRGIGHDRFKKVRLGNEEVEIPEQWEVKYLPDIASWQNGKAFPSKDYQSKGVLLVRPGNLNVNGTVEWDDRHTTHLPYHYWEDNQEYHVRDGEILMNLTAQSLEDQFLGRVCITLGDTKCLLNQRIARINPQKINRDFLFWSLKGPMFRKYLDLMPKGSKVQHLYNRDLEKAFVAVPEKESEQAKIADILSSFSQKEITAERELSKLQQIKKGLMQDLLTGKVRVKVSP